MKWPWKSCTRILSGFQMISLWTSFIHQNVMIGSYQKPHLIVIKNESFSDLSVLEIFHIQKSIDFF